MKRDLLSKSLAQMGSKPSGLSDPAPNLNEGGPRSLKSMSDVLSQVSAQSAQEIDVSEIADSEIADRFDVSEGLADLIESIRASGQQLPALLRYRRGSGPRARDDEVVSDRAKACAHVGHGERSNGRRLSATNGDDDIGDAVLQGVCTPEGADAAMKLGVNYPAGPFEWLARWSVAGVTQVLEALDVPYRGERYRISPWLRRQRA